MAYKGALMVDDETLFRTMEVAAETGALVMVHAENGDAIDVLVKQALAGGHTEPHYHALTRPPETEGEATNRAIQLARVAGSPLYVVHVSCAGGGRADRTRAREGLGRLGRDAARSTSSSTTRSSSGPTSRARSTSTRRRRATRTNQEVLWNAVRTDILSRDLDRPLRVPLGRPEDARHATTSRRSRTAGPGLENRLQMIHEFGVRAGRISLNRMVELLATNPAKLFGLYPRKGTIAVGSDADIVVFDPEKQVTISAATHHSKVGLQPLRGNRR